MAKLQVLLVFGGESPEHDVSIVSAKNVYAAIDKEKYDVKLCYIEKSGRWNLLNTWRDEPEGHGSPVTPVVTPGPNGTLQYYSNSGDNLAVDVLFPVLHGSHGEDGDIQGLARLMHVRCVGPSLIGAAITMDKDVTKRLLRDGGVPVVDWMTWHNAQTRPPYGDIVSQLGEILFVKPANAGSSVGVSKVRNEIEFDAALTEAAKYDKFILIERAMVGREIEVAVLGNEHAEVTEPGEIVPGEDFYSYDDKYAEDSKSIAIIPADLPAEVAKQVREYALKAYDLTRGQGMARIDFFVTEDNQIYLNEINSIPGFTNISMYPKLWQHAGLSYSELLDKLISFARDV